MIIHNPLQIKSNPLFYHLPNFINTKQCYLKLEGMNIAGSIKLKSALSMIEALEKKHNNQLQQKTLICSSSGNLAIALSIICNTKKYKLLCVSDLNISSTSAKLIKTYGAMLHIITEKDTNGGYLAKRIQYIHNLLNESNDYIWFNQYNNQANSAAHYSTTAREIHEEIPQLTHLFIGSGTTGTLMGCAKYFKQKLPLVKIIAVDADGSVTFGGKAKKRTIPGLGTSRKPELVDPTIIDDVIYIKEKHTIETCHNFVKQRGLFIGGSTGTVLTAVKHYPLCPNDIVVAISPDFGDKYFDIIYNSRHSTELQETESIIQAL